MLAKLGTESHLLGFGLFVVFLEEFKLSHDRASLEFAGVLRQTSAHMPSPK